MRVHALALVLTSSFSLEVLAEHGLVVRVLLVHVTAGLLLASVLPLSFVLASVVLLVESSAHRLLRSSSHHASGIAAHLIHRPSSETASSSSLSSVIEVLHAVVITAEVTSAAASVTAGVTVAIAIASLARSLVTVLVVNNFLRLIKLFRRKWIFRLSQLLVSVGEMAAFSEHAVATGLEVAAAIGLVF